MTVIEPQTEEEMILRGSAAPPMANGEVIFDAPWQSRIFGMARVLCEQGRFEWDEFRACLIQRIEQWQNESGDQDYYYFDHFLAAFTDIVAQKELCSSEEVDHRATQLDARPHGHDH